MKITLPLIGYASGIAGLDEGCADGPLVLKHNDIQQQFAAIGIDAYWLDMLLPNKELKNKVRSVADLAARLSHLTNTLVEQHQLFAVIGGDHSSAIGTWSGAAFACYSRGSLGLIWIDAHLDSHTPQTTESGNIHGMPLACLLGYGDPLFTTIASNHAKLLPENVAIIGVRSFEQGELKLLKKLGVRILFQEEVEKIGISAALEIAHRIVTHSTVGYGLSIDMDVLDPHDAPGVGNPVPNGISTIALSDALTNYSTDPALIGIELVEYNPHLDHDNFTKNAVIKLLFSLMQGRRVLK